MRYCEKLGFNVVDNRKNKFINKIEVCRAEELGKTGFEVDKKKVALLKNCK